MPTDPEPNGSSSSTTFGWRRVKIASPAASQSTQVPKGRRWRRLPRWNPRKRLTITVYYRGGPQCWYQVESRGSMGRFTGDAQLHDVMQEIYNRQ